MLHLFSTFLVFMLMVLTSCAPTPPKLTLQKFDFSELAGWNSNNDQSKALIAFRRSCDKFAELPDNYYLGEIAGRVGDWREICKESATTPPNKYRDFFETNFTPFKAGNNDNYEGLFTGYYEPELKGSRIKKGKFTEAVYKKPEDLTKPYLGRRRIGNGEISKRGLELLYVDDAVDLFFLHIQGSGRVKLEDGHVIRLGYAEQNGCPYASIGKYLIDSGEMEREEVTAPKIKEWLRENPSKAKDVMNKNTSYVFFRELKEVKPDEGPLGAQGVPLTPEHSLAIDKRFIPYGMPIWLETSLPTADEKPFRRLLVAQDTGGAIKGPARGDIFFGFGKKAEIIAGHMKQAGEYYLLVPKKLAGQIESASD